MPGNRGLPFLKHENGTEIACSQPLSVGIDIAAAAAVAYLISPKMSGN